MSYKVPLSVVLFFTFFSAIAQVTTSNMSGTVVDDQNLPLLGANVVVVHTPTGTKSGAITNEDGLFKILNLRVGG
ncbi:carboxypeptidase-like regulatory domain-containing protein, partial [Zobellia laminariae]|uniref:carboxypeptidase-like regulatory domain-containing protein n=1 Tax=Zobellia laminariae TaxID=248906 RepID=UPI003EF423FE